MRFYGFRLAWIAALFLFLCLLMLAQFQAFVPQCLGTFIHCGLLGLFFCGCEALVSAPAKKRV
jgi:hypothetical protein